jgi:CDP-diacylglycerol--glycerol-3-phosphate 3-phosphatidyltransferase
MSRPGRSRLARELASAPNLLSISRIALIFLAAGLMLEGWPITACLVGLAAGISDYLDGWLARRLGQVSELGAILDRLCDLVFESTWLVVAVVLGDFSPLILLAYLLREFVVLSARLWCSAHGVALGSTLVGKLKSNFLGYTALILYLSHSRHVAPLREALVLLADVGIAGGLVLSYWSATDYLKVFARAYNANNKNV